VKLPRVHAWEWMDQPWLPESLRAGLTDSLRGAEALTRLFDHAVPLLTDVLRRHGRRDVVDLAAGSGGPMVRLFPRVRDAGTVDTLTLTDLYPRPEAIAPTDGLRYLPTPVDATAVPPDLRGLRVVCNAFHHLPPDAARALLADAAQQGEPVLVMEALARTPAAMVAAVGVAAMAGLFGPLYRPWRLSRAAACWLVPIVPLLLVWEGLVSCLRCYTPDELTQLSADLGPPGWRWSHGEIRTGFIGAKIRWFLGEPGV
jgi:hypothetical protein